MKTSTLQNNEERLFKTINVSASIGETKNQGLYRLALSKKDKEMREIFIQWLEQEELSVRVDDFGNIYGRREGSNKNAPAVTFVFHVDSRMNGGGFSVVVGVIAGL